MQLNLGETIRHFRLQNSMTQEQLAQKLNVSAQAVSKWESGANMPDIQLLPDLSVVFGVSIDDLFSLSDDSRMERIENMLYNATQITDADFTAAVHYLQEKMSDPALNPRATLLLAQLYNRRAEDYHTLAKPLAREALRKLPLEKDAHNAVFDAENGAYTDWNYTNHYELIEFYKDVVEKHPDDPRNYLWLLDLLIADGRTAEAREYCKRMQKVRDNYLCELYLGSICRAECNLPEALEHWNKMVEREPENWLVHACYGDAMARLCRWDEALAAYRRAMPLRPVPRFYDCEEACMQIYTILGDFRSALDMAQRILEIEQNDWAREGYSVERIREKIHRLESKIASQDAAASI